MVQKFTNNAVTTLASGITNVATTLTVAAGTGVKFPTLSNGDTFYATLANLAGAVEIVLVTAVATDTFTITRAQDGTSAAAWSAGDKVELRIVASTLNTLVSTVYGFKNRIINGAMVIDQRNAGASVTPADGNYLVDRWFYNSSVGGKFTAQQNAGSVTPPAGFAKYLGFTSTSAYSIGTNDYFMGRQLIEGLNTIDLAWGTASASSVTLSFWVRSSLTGTFGGIIENAASNMCYTFAYTINSANTWEYKTIVVPGPTSGTWATDNSMGICLWFALGIGSGRTATAGSWGATRGFAPTGQVNVAGTNGATFYITGVQLEKGSTATSFDFRSYGTELQLCQRYYIRYMFAAGDFAGFSGQVSAATTARFPTGLFMRASPTVGFSNIAINDTGVNNTVTSASVSYVNSLVVSLTGSGGGLTTARAALIFAPSAAGMLDFSAEL